VVQFSGGRSVSAHGSGSVRRLLQSFLIGRLADPLQSPSLPDSAGREATSSLLENFLRIYGLLDIQYDHETPETQQALFRMQSYVHFCQEHLPQSLDLIRELDPCGSAAPDLDGVVLTWSPEMRTADWSDPEELGRLRLPELARLALGRSLDLFEEFIAITVRALEIGADRAEVQAQLWAAVTRWRDALNRPVRGGGVPEGALSDRDECGRRL
jgi:hypothetical protein